MPQMYENESINESPQKMIPFFDIIFIRCQKDRKKSWKIMENSLVNLYCIDFFYNLKIAKNRQELLHQPDIFYVKMYQNKISRKLLIFFDNFTLIFLYIK